MSGGLLASAFGSCLGSSRNIEKNHDPLEEAGRVNSSVTIVVPCSLPSEG